MTYEEILYVIDHDGFLPESAYTRSAEHLGITTSYDDYLHQNYHTDSAIHLSPVNEGIYIQYVPDDESNSANEDVSPESEPVYAINTIKCY